MLKMIIVDDEKIIRETIHSLIDWNSLGIDVAAVCKDVLKPLTVFWMNTRILS